MVKHLPFNEFDVAGITNTVNRYKEAGLGADYEIGRKAEGIVYITFANPVARDGSSVMFEVHKLAGPGWFGERAHWVVQLWSKAHESVPAEKRGCVTGKMQGLALTEAEIDLQHNFLSICDFELASRGSSPDRNRKRGEGELIVGAHIAAAFELLRREAPGAAYLFARTLVNVRPLVDDATMSTQQKIAAIQAEIDQSAEASRADAGIAVLAMKFTQRLLAVAERDVVASYTHATTFDDIAKAGERYRALEPRDRQPPANEGSRAILAKQGRTCVGELVDAATAECEQKDGDRDTLAEETATMLALFDLRDEDSSGRLQARLPALAAAIKSE